MTKCSECGSHRVHECERNFTTIKYKCDTCDAEMIEFVTPNGRTDNVNHPSHYKNGMKSDVECIMFTRCLSFNLGNAFKYVWRAGEKVSETMDTDVAKAMWYLKDAIEYGELTDLQYSATTTALIPFLPKSQLKDWKYSVLRYILLKQPEAALIILKSGSDTADTAS